MRVSISLCRNQKARKIVVAAPVCGMETAQELGALADDIVILTKPPLFRAVAQAYQNWYDVSDEEVLAIMKKW